MKSPRITKGVLDPKYCDDLIRIYNNHNHELNPDPVDKRPVYQITVYDNGTILNKELWDICKTINLPFEPTLVFLKRYRCDERPYITAHCDSSIQSFNVMVSSTQDFDGGEFFIFDKSMTKLLNELFIDMTPLDIDNCIASYVNLPIMRLEQGDMISYEGEKHLHGTLPVTSGERYVLAFFSE